MSDSNGRTALADRIAPTGAALEQAMELIHMLASEIGPRPSCSEAEREAAHRLAAWLGRRGADARVEEFDGYTTFALPYGILFAASLAGGVLQRSRGRRRRRGGDLVAAAALATAALEGDLRRTSLSHVLSRRRSANVVARVPAGGPARRRVCLVGHLDSTRSGLIFHPKVVRRLPLFVQVPAVSALAVAAGPLLRRLPGGRRVGQLALGGLGFSLAMLLERHLRGVDVPGASDNASGAAVALQLAAECAAAPLAHTEVDVLVTGCEESGILGAQAYARRHTLRAAETTFVNFDTVGGDVPLTYIMREGTGAVTRPASPRLVRLLEEIAGRRPDLGLERADTTPGLPTDATPMRARGWEAVTLLAQGDTVPHYHWPTDTYENVAPAAIHRALETGRELLRALDAEVRRGDDPHG
jgi:peptidase M28-like protein